MHPSIFLSLAFVGVCLAAFPLPTYTSPDAHPWPLPSSATNGSLILSIDVESLVMEASSSSGILHRAIGRYSNIIANFSAMTPLPSRDVPFAGKIVTLSISIASDDEALGPDTDESYELSIPAPPGPQQQAVTATISAKTVFGALHGLESFAQMVEYVGPGVFVVRGAPWKISDAPRFSHRGLLIDSARHFLPLSVIFEHIDAMAYNKLSVLHWHLVDSQTFPFASKSMPKISMGAWGPRSIYTPDDVTSVVNYAKDRGVRVMPEIDTPGHATSWGAGYPNILAACPNVLKTRGDAYGTLDPSTDETFTVVEALLREMADLFPDAMFHLGGDEVISSCWRESARITQFMEDMKFSTYDQLETYYFTRLLDIAGRVLENRTLVVYQDVFDNNVALPKNVVFDIWRGDTVPDELVKIVKAGHPVILANGKDSNWYFNNGWGNGNCNALWPTVYALDPVTGTSLTEAEQKLIVGGEASMWGEEVNENNLMTQFWPRASAFAERMWSPASTTSDAVAAAPRLARMYCRMEARKVRTAPISPGSCEHW